MKTPLRAIGLGIAGFIALSPAQGEPPEIVPPTSDEWDEIYVPTSRTPLELEVGSKLRDELFDLLRAKAGPTTRFSGTLKGFRNWAYFCGRTVDANGKSQKNPPLGNDDAVGLWLKTQEGWTVVAHSFGHSDAFYVIWPEQFGAPRELFGMSARPASEAGSRAAPATGPATKDNSGPQPKGNR